MASKVLGPNDKQEADYLYRVWFTVFIMNIILSLSCIYITMGTPLVTAAVIYMLLSSILFGWTASFVGRARNRTRSR